MPERLEGCLCLVLVMALVGSTVATSKIIVVGLSPFTATVLRLAMALPLFLLIMRMTRTRWPALAHRDWALLLVQATAGSVGYTTLLISGLQHTLAVDAGVIIGTLSVMLTSIAIVLLGERPGRAVLGAIGLATAGVLAIALQPRGDTIHSLLGNLLVMGAVVCEGLFILLNKRPRASVSPPALPAPMSAFGLLTVLLPGLWEAPWQLHASAQVTHALVAVTYYAIVPTVGGFVPWYTGATCVSGAEVSLFTVLASVAVVVFTATLPGEVISARQVGGIACVPAGVFGLGLVRVPWPVTTTTS